MKSNLNICKAQTRFNPSAVSPITTITWAVHTALRICYKILRLRETSCQTCEAHTDHIFSLEYILVPKYTTRLCSIYLTEFIGFSCHPCSNMGRNFSDVSKWWKYESLVEVFLCNLCCQGFSCSGNKHRGRWSEFCGKMKPETSPSTDYEEIT